MSSSDESDVELEQDTQFVYQSGDEDVLWAVQEITAERGNKYKVKWVGVDPSTAKPWPQSWVLKHDCTDDLVVEWKKKQKKKKKRPLATGKKPGRRTTSTASGTSGASKKTGSMTATTSTAVKTRRSTSGAATSSRLESVEQAVSPPPKFTAKRKRQSESPATTTTTTSTTSAVVEQPSESSRPRKKQKTMVDVLLPPISSEDEEDDVVSPSTFRAKDASRKAVLTKRNGLVDVSDGEESSLPKAKPAKPERRLDVRFKAGSGSSKLSDARGEATSVHAKTKDKVVPPRKERIANPTVLSAESEDEERRPPVSKKKSATKDRSTSKQVDGVSEKEAELPVVPIKVGPPRGAKRQEKRKFEAPSKPGPSHVKLRQDEHVLARESPEHASYFGSPLTLLQGKTNNHVSPRRISIPQVSPSQRPSSPALSPGARARLELFDRMMEEPVAAPAPDEPERAPDDMHFNFDDIHDNDIHDTGDAFGILDPPPHTSPPPQPKPKPAKPRTPNGLIVPETESSGNSQSQSQSQPLLMPPPPPPPQLSPRNPSPHKPMDLPAIAVIAASLTSLSPSPQNPIPQRKPPPSTNHLLKQRIKANPGRHRPHTKARPRIPDSDPPPSSIESFTSPKRVDKGKQKAVEEDQLECSLSEGEGDGAQGQRRTQSKVTDSDLRKRGEELFDQAQLAQQKIKKPKRLKAVNEIVNGMVSSPPRGSAPSFTENTLELQLEDVVDLNGGGNSMTLDTQEQSEAQPLSKEKRERLRIELRQEEEESTQEAMGIYPPPPEKEPEVMQGENVEMPPPRSPKSSSLAVDHVEQPSTDLFRASVIVQASQEQRHEDMDMDPSPVNQATSSPARPIPENLTDSPKRRLGEALSLLNVKSEEIQRLERELADERNNVQSLKTELAKLRESSEPTGPVRAAWDAERAQWTQERTKWENDVSAWEAQRKEMSEEKAGLEARVAELSEAVARAEEATEESQGARLALTVERSALQLEMAQRSEELVALARTCAEYDEARPKWEAERTSWAEEKARWETERTALLEKQETLSRSVDELTASVESTKAAKGSVEQDRDFFREQYQQASTFVGSVRDENIELEKRVNIAEGQAKEGVAAIKTLFEGRVKALQADIDRWKGLTELLQEKDRRTNDELRLRAAQAPELIELCGRLNAENNSLEAEARKLGQAQQRSVHQRNRLFYEILLLKKERASLRSKLSKRKKAPDNSISIEETSVSVTAPPTIQDLEEIDPNDMESLPDLTPQPADTTFDEPTLFPCMWRPQWRDQCQQVFDTKEDLERHMQEHYLALLDQ